jgi:uncharacterized protein (DUF58 family)
VPVQLLDEDFLRKLEQLSLLARKIRTGAARGENISIHKGASLEFSDYRLYQPGDDFRYLDWNIYSRLHKLFVKLFSAEEDLTVHILIDTSKSMAFGDPSKLWYGGRLAAALAYMAINNLDRVGVSAFAEGIEHSLQPIRQTSHVFTIFDYIAGLRPSGKTEFNRTLRDYSLRTKRPGLAILISDLLDPNGYEEGLRALIYRRFDIMLIQVLDEEELLPRLKGPYRLVDGETDEETELNVEPETVVEYKNRLGAYFQEIEDFCLSHDVEYLRTSNRIPFEDVVFSYLRRGVFVH